MQAQKTSLNWAERDDVLSEADEMRHMLGELENTAASLLLHHRAQKETGKQKIDSAYRRDIFNTIDGLEHVIEHIDDTDLHSVKLELGGVRETLFGIEEHLFYALTKEKEPGYWMLWNKATDAFVDARDACGELFEYDSEFERAENNITLDD